MIVQTKKALLVKAEKIAKESGDTMQATMFMNGADWYRNRVWHQASEEPADKAQCLVIRKRKTKDVVTYSNRFFYKGHVVAEPCKIYALTDIVLWAYIEDLLPDSSNSDD